VSLTVDRAPARHAPRGVAARLYQEVTHGFLLTGRNLRTLVRVPTVFVFELVQPLMFVLLFRYIYANQLATLQRGLPYVLFLMPGIFVQNAIFGATTTAIGLAEDMKKGIIDRFRSLPMARSAVLAGRTTFDVAKNAILVSMVILIGYVVGFRFQNGFVNAVLVVVLVLAVGFTFSWISACIGLALKEVEAVQAASFTWIFPVVFVSSAFVPVQGMASFLQVVARNNPVTQWCNLARYLSLGPIALLDPQAHQPIDTIEGVAVKSVAWIAGLLIVFVPLAIRLYRRLT
jgi:ABC transporter DrrB family efflux protein